jgi:hypothetical protein
LLAETSAVGRDFRAAISGRGDFSAIVGTRAGRTSARIFRGLAGAVEAGSCHQNFPGGSCPLFHGLFRRRILSGEFAGFLSMEVVFEFVLTSFRNGYYLYCRSKKARRSSVMKRAKQVEPLYIFGVFDSCEKLRYTKTNDSLLFQF